MSCRAMNRPAFPQPNSQAAHQSGMTLRDWFAGQALANSSICRHDDEYPQKTAYAFADAMLKERGE